MPYTGMLNKTVVLLVIVGLVFLFCVVMIVLDNIKNNRSPVSGVLENFADPPAEVTDIQKQLDGLTDDQLKGVVSYMKDKLVGYNLLPEQRAQIDQSQWVPKSNIPPAGPRVDLSQYMKKSSCPPEKVCPPQKEIDYSQYVKRSTIPPQQQCPPCVAPKVKVSAGLCEKCPPCPTPPPCPTCPVVTCPKPEPCPKPIDPPKCSEIKYIKVPTIITRTIKLDAANNVVSEEVASEEDGANNTTKTSTTNSGSNNSSNNTSSEEETSTEEESSPSTTSASNNTMTTNYTIPTATRAANKRANEQCNVVGLNSEFRKYGIYGLE